MKDNKIFALGLTLFIASCAPVYKPDINSSSPKMSSTLRSFDTAFICVDNKKYSASDLMKGKPVFLRANKQVTVQLGIASANNSPVATAKNSCAANSTFVPVSNGEYNVELDYEHDLARKRFSFENGCQVAIMKNEGSTFRMINSHEMHDRECMIGY